MINEENIQNEAISADLQYNLIIGLCFNDAIAIRPLAFVSLTFDHRILDGKGADDFMVTFKDTLENWR